MVGHLDDRGLDVVRPAHAGRRARGTARRARLLEHDGPQAALREVVGDRRARRAGPDHRDVVGGHITRGDARKRALAQHAGELALPARLLQAGEAGERIGGVEQARLVREADRGQAQRVAEARRRDAGERERPGGALAGALVRGRAAAARAARSP